MNEKFEESIDTSSNEESVDTNSNVTKTYGSQLRATRIALKKSIQE